MLKHWSTGSKTRAANYSPVAKSGPTSVFVNKVLLEHNHNHLFTYCLGLLSWYNSRLEYIWQWLHTHEVRIPQRPLQSICWLLLSVTSSPLTPIFSLAKTCWTDCVPRLPSPLPPQDYCTSCPLAWILCPLLTLLILSCRFCFYSNRGTVWPLTIAHPQACPCLIHSLYLKLDYRLYSSPLRLKSARSGALGWGPTVVSMSWKSSLKIYESVSVIWSGPVSSWGGNF